MAEITPMENLYIQALAPITNQNIKAGDTYKKLRAGFAYTVPGLVKIKGQYIGKGEGSVKAGDKVYGTAKDIDVTDPSTFKINDDYTISAKDKTAAADKDGNSNCTLEAEVDVLAVEGLFAGVGFQYNVIKDGDDKADQAIDELIAKVIAGTITEGKFNQDVAAALSTKMKIAAGVSYQVMPELKVSASGAFFTYYGEDVDPRFQAGLGVDYDLGDGLAANADFRYLSKAGGDGEKLDNTDKIAFSVGVKKSVSSNGSIGVAFQGVTNSGNLGGVEGLKNDKDEAKNFVWAIPVAFEISF
jgi:hypothetical protein